MVELAVKSSGSTALRWIEQISWREAHALLLPCNINACWRRPLAAPRAI